MGLHYLFTFVNLASLLKPYLSLYRTLGLQDDEVPRISRQAAHPPGDIPGTHLL
jgi:hypothetical protein